MLTAAEEDALEVLVLRACVADEITFDDCRALRVTIARMVYGNQWATVRGSLNGWRR